MNQLYWEDIFSSLMKNLLFVSGVFIDFHVSLYLECAVLTASPAFIMKMLLTIIMINPRFASEKVFY